MSSAVTACILCSRNCGLKVDIQDGHFVKILGDEQHPISKGYICQKTARLGYITTATCSPKRLITCSFQ